MSDDASLDDTWYTPEMLQAANRETVEEITDFYLDQLRTVGASAPRKAVVDVTFPATDGAFRAFCGWLKGNSYEYQRRVLTFGSVVYTIAIDQSPIAMIEMRAVNINQTYLQLNIPSFTSSPPETSTLLQGMAVNLFWIFINFLAGEQKITMPRVYSETMARYVNDIPTEPTVSPIIPAQAVVQDERRGRPTHKEDDWAWAQVNEHNQPRDEVYEEWKQRVAQNRRELADLRRSFNHAISPERTPKTRRRKK